MKALYSIRDELIGYGNPFSAPDNDALVIRDFKAAVKSPEPNACNQNPEDIVLFKLATFDEQSGEIVPQHTQLLRATEVK